ncbi:MAG: hypothetical protein P1V97_22620 [Planctomycetota bacterium]|nr:hypothetical protein [Planctomycetota bacterium]
MTAHDSSIIKATCIAVVVDAKDLSAENFYKKYGFITFEESAYPRRMGLSMDKLKRACNTK